MAVGRLRAGLHRSEDESSWRTSRQNCLSSFTKTSNLIACAEELCDVVKFRARQQEEVSSYQSQKDVLDEPQDSSKRYRRRQSRSQEQEEQQPSSSPATAAKSSSSSSSHSSREQKKSILLGASQFPIR